MMWLPEHGVGLFAMANLTYAGASGVLQEVADILRQSGGLQPRELPPTPVLTSMRDTIYRSYWQRWDQTAVQRTAANNLLLDIPGEARRVENTRLRARAGQCSGSTDVVPENLLRGVFRINCENGPVHVNFTLAPTQPPTIQHLQFSEKPFATGDNVCRP